MPRLIIKRRKATRKVTVAKKRSFPIHFGKYRMARMRAGGASLNADYARVRENYIINIPAGAVQFYRNFQLADLAFDRSQAVAQAYQQFRIKYIRITFRPNYDTYQAGPPGNARVPQLYFMYDKSNSIPTNANAGTFSSIGCRPYRMDDKNLVRAWKPTVLNAPMTANAIVTASQVLTSPWLSTNANSGNPGAAWAPSEVDHLGCAFYITNTVAGDAQIYNADVEILFEFRKPTWGATQE